MTERQTRWSPERIKNLRERYGETQEQFRHRFPVSISTMKFWETAGVAPPIACTLLDRLEEDLTLGRMRELQTA